jgi:flavodoxin I
MGKIGLFFGSSTGKTARVAELIKTMMGDEVVSRSVSDAIGEDLEPYDLLILGTSTWGVGDLQEDWAEFFEDLDHTNLKGKRVAIFGLGDQATYPNTFQNGMGIIYQKVTERGAKILGRWPVDGYEFARSTAVVDNKFVGLALDEDNQEQMTRERVRRWVEFLKKEMSKGR